MKCDPTADREGAVTQATSLVTVDCWLHFKYFACSQLYSDIIYLYVFDEQVWSILYIKITDRTDNKANFDLCLRQAWNL